MTASLRSPFLRPDLDHWQPVTHGSVAADELAELGLHPSDVLDFSVNTNPLGPAPTVLEAISHTNWTRYPGDDETPLRTGLATAAGIPLDYVALGNGSSELVWLICLAVLRRSLRDTVAVVGPTFGEYARAARVMAADVVEVRSLTDVPTSARLAFVCNPNNPTGTFLDAAVIDRVVRTHPDTVIVLDEAYATFVTHRWPSEQLLKYPNVVLLRSLTKDHALPGLRLGYLLAQPDLAHAIEAVRPPWSVNAGALRAGLATLRPAARQHVDRARAVVATSRGVLTDGLAQLGYPVEPSHANFLIADVANARAFRRALLPHRLVVRDCTSFGLVRHVRIACKLPDECARLLDTVAGLRRSGALPVAESA